jgi:1,4-alpha-glucan branching enzyme
MLTMRSPLIALLLAGCSLTPIPDVTSNWSEPCDTSLRSCDVEFKLAAGAEHEVELRGDFRADAWVHGVPMQESDGAWRATVLLQWGANVQYKFFIDGETWKLDPANPKTAMGGSNTNSLLSDVTCVKWACAGQ